MAPRPPKGMPPKGPQPVISFRINSKIQDLIQEIRTIERYADPGFIPSNIGSDSEFARWIFLENIEKVKNTLIAKMKIKDLIVKLHSLNDRSIYIEHKINKNEINKEDGMKMLRELESQIDDINVEISEICMNSNIEIPI